jgi:hypothetical protein
MISTVSHMQPNFPHLQFIEFTSADTKTDTDHYSSFSVQLSYFLYFLPPPMSPIPLSPL